MALGTIREGELMSSQRRQLLRWRHLLVSRCVRETRAGLMAVKRA